MAWHHVEDTDPQDTEERAYIRTSPFDGGGTFPAVCSKTLAFSTFRCGNCRALCVTPKGQSPSGGCGKCGAGKPAEKRKK